MCHSGIPQNSWAATSQGFVAGSRGVLPAIRSGTGNSPRPFAPSGSTHPLTSMTSLSFLSLERAVQAGLSNLPVGHRGLRSPVHAHWTSQRYAARPRVPGRRIVQSVLPSSCQSSRADDDEDGGGSLPPTASPATPLNCFQGGAPPLDCPIPLDQCRAEHPD